jgi:competence protein ComEC
MRRVGLSHLTAVSGANFAIIAALMLWLSRWIFRSIPMRLIFTSTVLLYFILLVRPSPSVLRASVMSAVLLFATWRGNRSSALPALGLAIGLLILVDPFQAIDPGFALSVAATAGILLLVPPITRYLTKLLGFPAIAELIAIPISATILCTPIIIAISGNFSLVTVPANLLAGVVVTPITISGFVAALFPPIAHLLLTVIKPLAEWIVVIAHSFASAPTLHLPMGYLGAALVIALTYLVYRFRWRAAVLLIVIVPSVIYLQNAPWPGPNWEIANCDVGQGDGLAINLGEHRAIVIDAGPDPLVIDKCLSRLGITTVPLFVITHFHADHAGGASGVLKNRKVEQIWISNNSQPLDESAHIRQISGSIPEIVVRAGEKFTVGTTSIEVLWPGTAIDQSINNSSIALLIKVGGASLFAAGDIEPPAQSAILASHKITHVDVLKVAHHGSRFQDFALLDALSPRFAIISVGAGNTYGHPAPITLDALAQRGVKILRTDRDGAISIDSSFRIRTQRKKWWMISWG